MALPNLLLAGAPKCGTTSVYDWLVSHPAVSGGVEKEVFYLVDPVDSKFRKDSNWQANGIAGYEKLYPLNNQYVVDGTTLTMYQKSALEYAGMKYPKAVFFVREPAMRVYSNFKYHKNNRSRLPADYTFEQYLNALQAGESFGGNTQLQNAVEHSFYVDHIAKFAEVLGKDSVKVYVFEDFVADPRSGMKDLSCWLGIDSAFYNDFVFDKQNESVNMRNAVLNRVKEWLGERLGSAFKPDWLRKVYRRLNTMPAAKFENDDDGKLLADLKLKFSDKNEQLAAQFCVDISSWK